MKKIETIIKRDNSLIDVKAWHLGYTSGLKEWLGWSYSDTLFYIHDGYTEVMRPPHEHTIEFREFVLKKIDTDQTWLKSETKKFDDLISEINIFYGLSIEKINIGSNNNEIALIYEKYVAYISKAMGPYITMFWIPNWLENDPVRFKKYENEITLALEYRKKTEFLFPNGAKLTDLILSKISSDLKIDIKLLRVLSTEELLSYLEQGIRPNEKELENRLTGFVYSKEGIILTDNTVENLKEVFASLGYEYEQKIESIVNELKGQIACKGIVKGKVRIILSKMDIILLEEGEILVTSMTTPEYLPAMKKSSAFVTDEGGITCHAAIIARELGKPCIIGTKNATSVFKTGDLVEVDAEKGVVRIIKT